MFFTVEKAEKLIRLYELCPLIKRKHIACHCATKQSKIKLHNEKVEGTRDRHHVFLYCRNCRYKQSALFFMKKISSVDVFEKIINIKKE